MNSELNCFEEPQILVAEDEEVNFIFMREMLASAGYNLLRAHDGREAISICEARSDIGLVIMDLKMPIMDGLEAARQIRAQHPQLPILAHTAYVTASDENQVFAAGCNDYITKPVRKNLLLRKIAKYLPGSDSNL